MFNAFPPQKTNRSFKDNRIGVAVSKLRQLFFLSLLFFVQFCIFNQSLTADYI
jgi:hypothetical protein